MIRIVTEVCGELLTYINPLTKKGRIGLAMLVVLLLIGPRFFGGTPEEAAVETVNQLKTVKLATASSLSGNSSIELIGSVESASQAEIESEVSGRVTAVNVELGDTVVAGQIIAQLENASEFAAVLQAEGSYEAALAAAAQSDVSTEDANANYENALQSGINTYRSAFTTVDSIIQNTVDDIFNNPDNGRFALKIDGFGTATAISDKRKTLNPVLDTWSANTFGANPENAATLLREAKQDTEDIAAYVETIASLIARQEGTGTFSEAEFATLESEFTTARNNLNSTISSIDAALLSISSASDALERAEISGTNTDVSAANAQIKQALGSLRSAQANLAKTILRSPISGTVNELDVQTGDFISSFTRAALVANNNALEITTFVGESDRDALTIGDTVTIEGVYDGIITNIAPAVDTETRKVEVKIAAETTELANGDSVRISIGVDDTEKTEEIVIPLAAVKFTADSGSVFKLEDTTLVAVPVELGDIRGSSIVVQSGISAADEIVTDARGLSSGQQVEGIY